MGAAGREESFPKVLKSKKSAQRGEQVANLYFSLVLNSLFRFLLFSTSGIRQSRSGQRGQGSSPKQKEFRQLLGNIPSNLYPEVD